MKPSACCSRVVFAALAQSHARSDSTRATLARRIPREIETQSGTSVGGARSRGAANTLLVAARKFAPDTCVCLRESQEAGGVVKSPLWSYPVQNKDSISILDRHASGANLHCMSGDALRALARWWAPRRSWPASTASTGAVLLVAQDRADINGRRVAIAWELGLWLSFPGQTRGDLRPAHRRESAGTGGSLVGSLRRGWLPSPAPTPRCLARAAPANAPPR